MGILDQLMEKKDLMAYITFRIQILHMEYDQLKTIKPKRKEMFRQRLTGRVRELEQLKKLIEQGNLKKQSINDWNKLHPIKKE